MALGGTYNTGLIGVTAGSTAVSGHGVLWSAVVEGDTLRVGADDEIVDTISGTYDGIVLKDPWAGPTVPMGTATMTIASPCVVTWPAAAPPDGTPVVLAKTGTLPTGLTEGTIVYCKSPSGSTSNLAATPGGAAINTTGSQSGVHTIGAPYRIYYDSKLRFDPALTQDKLRTFINQIETSALFGVPFEWDTGTSDADPGAGLIRANNISLALATLLYISKTSRVGGDVAAFLAGLDDSTNPSSKGNLILGAQPEGTQAIFTIGAVTDATGYIKLAISNPSGVTSFLSGDLINFQFTPAGDVGIDPDASGTLTERNTYDDEAIGFKFLQTDVSPFKLWIKASNATADWAGPSYIGYVASDSRVRFVFEGDSLSNTSNAGTWPNLLATTGAFFMRGTNTCVAADGQTIATIIGQYATQVAPYKPIDGKADECWLFIWAGTNDISAGTSAATVYGNLQTEWASAHADGFKVVAFTIMPNINHDATKSAQRIALNNLILSDTSLYDFVMRPDVWFPDISDIYTFLSSGVHLTDNGNAILARKVCEVLAVSTQVPAAPHNGAQGNMIINGAMDISQENGATSGSTNQFYAADQFLLGFSNVSASVQNVADAPPGLSNSIKVTVTAADASPAAGDLLYLATKIEGSRLKPLKRGLASAQWATLFFFVKSSAELSYGLSQVNSAVNRSYVNAITVNTANVWQFKRVFVPPEIAGTWLNAENTIGSVIFFGLAIGSTFQASTLDAWGSGFYVGWSGQGNLAATNGSTFQLTGVGMVPGVEFVTPEQAISMMRSSEEEKLLCQRYWQKSYDYATAPGAASTSVGAIGGIAISTTTIHVSGNFAREMMKIPTVTLYSYAGTSGVWNDSANADTAAASTSGRSTKRLPIITSSGLTAGNYYSGHLVMNSRL